MLLLVAGGIVASFGITITIEREHKRPPSQEFFFLGVADATAWSFPGVEPLSHPLGATS